MKKSTLLALVILSVLTTGTSHASVVLSIFVGRLQNESAATVPTNTLIQLINLGPDGVFNPITLTDGDTTPLGQWVSGDDTLVDLPYAENDFPSARAFDLAIGADPASGIMERDFGFESLAEGTKIGVRWWPTLTANNVSTNFNSFTLTNGTRYGQFTRQSNPQHGGELWVVPADGIQIQFDALATSDIAGNDSVSLGQAAFIVPEPATASFLGLGLLIGMRRRKH